MCDAAARNCNRCPPGLPFVAHGRFALRDGRRRRTGFPVAGESGTRAPHGGPQTLPKKKEPRPCREDYSRRLSCRSERSGWQEQPRRRIPKTTQKVLKELKIDPSLLNGLDAELNIPKSWITEGNKEGKVLVLGTWNARQFETMLGPFRERYPKIHIDYNRAGTMARGLNVVIALKEGRVIGDVLTSFADAAIQLKSVHALANLGDLPGFKNVDREYTEPWVSHKISYRCIGFNTTRIKREDMPKTWDDLLTDTKLRGGKLAMTNHPNSWLLGLWAIKGQKWGEEFTRRLFLEVKPQQRKEGMTAATALTVAGEFTANLPAPEWQELHRQGRADRSRLPRTGADHPVADRDRREIAAQARGKSLRQLAAKPRRPDHAILQVPHYPGAYGARLAPVLDGQRPGQGQEEEHPR